MTGAAGFAWKHGQPGRLTCNRAAINRQLSVAEAQQPARASFVLSNSGGTPVQITKMTSSCSCTKATASTTTIPPGGLSTVELEANPVAVGSVEAVVTIETDSPLTRVVPLHFRVETVRSIPFMHRAGGELIFNGHYAVGDTREFLVVTMEPTPSGHQKPDVSVDLPFCTISEPQVTSAIVKLSPAEKEAGQQPHFRCLYTYQLILNEPPSSADGFTGRVKVVDPWDFSHVERIFVQGEPTPNIVAGRK